MAVDKDLRKIMQIVDKNKLKMSDSDYIDACRSIQQVHLKLKGKRIFNIKIPLNHLLTFVIMSKGLITLISRK